MFAIGKAGNPAAVDAGFDQSITASVLLNVDNAGAEGYDIYRRIGSVLTDGSSNIIAFTMHQSSIGSGGRVVQWADPPLDYQNLTLSTSQDTAPLSVPPGVVVRAFGNGSVSHASAQRSVYVRGPAANDEAPVTTAPPLATYVTASNGGVVGGQWEAYTNITAQVIARSSAADTAVRLATLGWEE